AIQVIAFLGSAIATARLSAAGDLAQWIAVFACGVSVFVFFPLMHESGHQTAFESRAWNEIGVWLGALVMLQAPSFFREFHWEHHRSTQDREHDPEISAAPALLDGWPTNPISYLLLASGQFLMLGKLGFTMSCALFPVTLWSRFFPFVRSERRARVARESRLALLLITAFVVLGWRLVPGFSVVLVAWPIAHVLLGFYLMAEHTGLPNAGDQLERSRSVRSNAMLRWLMWNMPYHAEHHAYPGIPYHALPALHQLLEPALRHTSSGYLRFHLAAGAGAFRRR
ncbi:MAG: fatty acid desaturase, partial [Myxococcota bacterium]